MGWELGTNNTYLKRFFVPPSVTTARVRGVAGSWIWTVSLRREILGSGSAPTLWAAQDEAEKFVYREKSDE